MENGMTSEELGQIIRAARVLAIEFSEEQLKSLLIAQQKLADSGFLDAVWGMARLQKEQGVSCSEALDANKALIKQKTGLERELTLLRKQVNSERTKVSEAKKIHQQMVDNVNAANSELEAVRSDVRKEQDQLSSLRKRAETEKGRIEKDLERRMKNAGVSSEEIVTAGRLKTEVEKIGVTLETMLKNKPEMVVRLAVRRMLPQGPLGRDMYKKLRVYAGDKHPHIAQSPLTYQL